MTTTVSKVLTLTEVSKLIGKPKRTLYNMLKTGTFPIEHIRGTKPRLWNSDDIEAWKKNSHAEL